jgi:ABC-2 type transport system ATP-binding protein
VPSFVVEVKGLTREYAHRRAKQTTIALAGVDLAIADGETHGLLGPNGAGKSTLVKILATLLVPTSGAAYVLGHDVVTEPRQIRARIGVVFGGERGLYNRVSARQNLEFWSALYQIDRRTAKRRCAELL